ncbi:Relaxase/Mobilisation nuclease domain-containing protein [Mucilaginibacter pineti]|uniref:Relaxase/Mobilisation nuclease domain-containing protein n=1 Tax=Mucilaginibacter pineti TaxID=1391627 RepID=A0A1G6ZJD6_9SPHI|nr:relaxase/mobilization nuclease domain-containing protein [Mucilaginibacter pineti]SDE01656.1 Relaxase/Mobilisation nuclease domain-containing protein [Mucilaginibacter pineti]
MVAKIKSGKSLIGALNYNENKVKQGKAMLIAAVKYFKDPNDLSFNDKLFRLTDLASMNQRSKTNTVHISLNFPNGENLADDILQEIVKDYLHGVGFSTQPYLVYRHEDAGHPHIHIVTTNIKRDGERISLHYLGQNESEKTRKAIEIKYGLVKADEQTKQKPNLKADVSAAEYGKAETKRAITNILGFVLRAYKFTSIPEFNGVLGVYNIQADRGSKDSRMYAREGLVYWVLDKKGNKVGVPIKASTVYGKPALKTLEEKFKLNAQLRKPFKDELIKILDGILIKPLTKGEFQKALREKGVQCILRQNDEGRIYGVTFIDQKNKAVFNGSDLGKAYSANQISAQLSPDPVKPKFQHQHEAQANNEFSEALAGDKLINVLIAPELEDLAALNKFKKKKRKGLNLYHYANRRKRTGPQKDHRLYQAT